MSNGQKNSEFSDCPFRSLFSRAIFKYFPKRLWGNLGAKSVCFWGQRKQRSELPFIYFPTIFSEGVEVAQEHSQNNNRNNIVNWVSSEIKKFLLAWPFRAIIKNTNATTTTTEMLKIVGFFFLSICLVVYVNNNFFFSPFSLVLNVPSTKCGQIKCRRFCTIVSRKRPRLGPAIQLTNTNYPYPRSDLPQSTSTWTDSGHEIRIRLAKRSYLKFRPKLCRLSCRRCRL